MAVKKYALRGLSSRELGEIIHWNDAFLASNISGHGTIGHARVKGRLSDEMYAQYATSQYAVYSYDTAIAWHVQENWYVNGDNYSPTTSYHQRLIKEALAAVDTEFVLL